MKLQAQAVLRRVDVAAPLRLVGVLMAGAFHPLTAQDAWDRSISRSAWWRWPP